MTAAEPTSRPSRPARPRPRRPCVTAGVGPDDGEMAGGGPISCRIIEDGSRTRHRMAVIEAQVPPGPGSPPQHVHREHDEIFIVTKGKLRFTSDTESFEAEAGTTVTVPA